MSNCSNEILPAPFFVFANEDGRNSTIQFTPYVDNIPNLESNYPPPDLGLSSVVELDTASMVQIEYGRFLCLVCDSPLLDNACGSANQGISATTDLFTIFRELVFT